MSLISKVGPASCLVSKPKPRAEHSINGEILCMLDPETLKGVGVTTIGQRLAILKAIYQLKLAHNIPLEPEDYIPPCSLPSFIISIGSHFVSSRGPGPFRIGDSRASTRNGQGTECVDLSLMSAMLITFQRNGCKHLKRKTSIFP